MAEVPNEAVSVPTLTEWGVVIMALLFGGSAIYRLRQRGNRERYLYPD